MPAGLHRRAIPGPDVQRRAAHACAGQNGRAEYRPRPTLEVGGIGPYSNVLKEGDKYKMWYQVMASVQWHIDLEAGAICYAESSDGIHW